MDVELTDADVADLLSSTVFEDGAQFDDALSIIPIEPMHHGHDHGADSDADADSDVDSDGDADADADSDSDTGSDVDSDADADAGADEEAADEPGDADEPADRPEEETDADADDADDVDEPEEKPEEETDADEPGDADESDSNAQSDDGSDDPVADDEWQVVAYGDSEADFELFADIQISEDGSAALYGSIDMGYGPISLELQGMSRYLEEGASQVSVRGAAGETAVFAEEIGISRECGYIQGGSLKLVSNGSVVEMAFSDDCDSCFTVAVDGIDEGKACID